LDSLELVRLSGLALIRLDLATTSGSGFPPGSVVRQHRTLMADRPRGT
jgi:hypothetical protein